MYCAAYCVRIPREESIGAVIKLKGMDFTMVKKKIVVIFGGFSPEYEVSLKSSYSIINAINCEKYEVILLGITNKGQWYRYYGDVENIPSDMWHTDDTLLRKAYISPERDGGLIEISDGRIEKIPVDAVFPVLHGRYGEDGTVQGLCELARIPVVGAGSAASALCMDKDRAHKLVSLAGIRVPKSVCFELTPTEADLHDAVRELKLPIFLKPVKAGSSLGIKKIDSLVDIPKAVKEAFRYDNAILMEESIEGMEVGCAVVGNFSLQTGRVDEIEVTGGFFDYGEKYTLKTSKIHVPARIDEKTESRLQETAKIIYRTLGCRGYARMDMYLTNENEIVFLEANTIPGFTTFSQFPRMMNAAGIDYPELVDMLINLSLQTLQGEWYG